MELHESHGWDGMWTEVFLPALIVGALGLGIASIFM